MAELADALDLGSSGVTRTGSIPASRTIIIVLGGDMGKRIIYLDTNVLLTLYNYPDKVTESIIKVFSKHTVKHVVNKKRNIIMLEHIQKYIR